MAQGIALLSSTIGWPVLQLGVFWLRFHRMPPGGWTESLVFVPMGLLAGVALAVLLTLSRSAGQRRFTVYGYLLASPVALVGSLLSGLALPFALGPVVFGGIPLLIGSSSGYWLGRRDRTRTA